MSPRDRRPGSALDFLELQTAEMLFSAGDCVQALPHLARVLRRNPANSVAAQRVVAALSQRQFALPILSFAQVSGIAFSSDGGQLLTGSGKTVTIREAQTGRLLCHPLEHSEAVLITRFAPDRKRLVTVAWDKAARLWDALTGQPACEPLTHDGYVRVAEFSPDGRRLVTSSDDGIARVWDAHTGAALLGPLRHAGVQGMAYIVRFSPDGNRILTVCEPQACVHLWDAHTGQSLAEPIEHDDQVVCAEFSPDGERLLTVTDGPATLRVWEARTGRPLAIIGPGTGSGDSVASARFSPDGARILAATHGNWARVYEARTGRPACPPLAHRGRVLSAEFNPNGLLAVTASEDHTARVWDTRTGLPVWEPLLHPTAVFHAVFSPDGRHLATRCMDSGAWVWEMRPGQLMSDLITETSFERAKLGSNAHFSRGGEWLVAVAGDGIRVLNAVTGLPLGKPLPHTGQVDSAAISPDGRLVLTSWHGPGNDGGYARLWEVQTGEPLSEPLVHEGYKGCGPAVEFSPDGKRFVTACGWNFRGFARVWDASTGRPLTGPIEHKQQVYCARFSPDGRRVVTTSTDGARLWEAASGNPLGQLLKHDGLVYSARFSPNGRLVLTASADHTARVWNVQTGVPKTEPLTHEGEVWHAEFSPDGRRVLTVSGDHTARVWDARTGELLVPPLQHRSAVRHGTFSADGKRVLTGSDDGCVRVWHTQTGQPLSEMICLSAPPHAVQFDQEGKSAILVPAWGRIKRWDVGIAPVPCTPWIPDLAEAVAGRRFNKRGVLEPFPLDESLALREEIRAQSDPGFYTRWAQWFLGPVAERAVSAFSTVTVQEYVRGRIQDDTLASLIEAVRLAPANARALARLAIVLLLQGDGNDPGRLGEADFFSRQAFQLAPEDAEVAAIRREVEGQRGGLAPQ